MEKSNSSSKRLLPLTIGALGVVYGDIGTSPLYAIHAALHGLTIEASNVLGVLSLIFWTLIIIVSIKYLSIILNADNEGEGGILALLALLKKGTKQHSKLLLITSMMGAGLLLGDGIITPSISVLSAVEGLNIITPAFSYLVLPITCLILILLFINQRRGTGVIGYFFCPIIIVWFITIGLLGLRQIIHLPWVLYAVNPMYGVSLFIHHPDSAYIILGGIFLVVTGGEALYADLGHFGKAPIRLGWYTIVLPGLLLNYFGQGAYLITHPTETVNPFYQMAPSYFLYPLLIIATAATIIASQAVISALFSLAKQAILLDFLPRLKIIRTSVKEKGQVYVPFMNKIMLIGTVWLVLEFKASANLAGIYGVAVNLIMLSVTMLVALVAFRIWKWSLLKVLIIFSLFILIDITFLGANFLKLAHGGLLPVTIAILSAAIMLTWFKGTTYLKLSAKKVENDFLNTAYHLIPTQSTSILIIDKGYEESKVLEINSKMLNIKQKNLIILDTQIADTPRVSADERFELELFSPHAMQLTVHYGFNEIINVPKALEKCNELNLFPFEFQPEQTMFFMGMSHIVVTLKKAASMRYWQKKFYSILYHNVAQDIDFYQLPHDRTILIGNYREL